MADLIIRASAAIALCAVVLGANACSASEPQTKSSLASVNLAASYAETIFRDLDDATGEAYVLQTLGTSGQVGAAQPCMGADNRMSRRPSALANPPYAEASINQRGRIVRALGAFAILKTALAHAKSVADVAPEIANFQAAAFELNVAANVHAQGDLFIDEGASDLVALGTQLHAQANPRGMQMQAMTASLAIDKLIGIARDDIEKRRLEATYLSQVNANRTLEQRSAHVPQCGEPVIPQAAASLAPIGTASLPPLVREARADSLATLHDLDALSLDDFFGDLHAIDVAMPEDTATLDTALARLVSAMSGAKR